MARTCPDCGKQVADNARTCMNCGCNLRLRRVWTWALRLMAGVGVLAGIYGIVWVGVYLTVSGVPLSGGAMTSAYFECHRRVSDQLSPDGRSISRRRTTRTSAKPSGRRPTGSTPT